MKNNVQKYADITYTMDELPSRVKDGASWPPLAPTSSLTLALPHVHPHLLQDRFPQTHRILTASWETRRAIRHS